MWGFPARIFEPKPLKRKSRNPLSEGIPRAISSWDAHHGSVMGNANGKRTTRLYLETYPTVPLFIAHNDEG